MATPYHRLAREHPDHAWWKLPVAGLVGGAGYAATVIALVLGSIVVVLVANTDDPDAIDRWFDDLESGLMVSPWAFAVSMVMIALMLPAVVLGVLATGPRPVGYLSSVAGHLRWGWFARILGVAFMLYTAVILGSLALGVGGGLASPSLAYDAVVYFLLALLLTPVQAAAEEYVFRGYLFQLVGSWTRFAIVPVLVSTPLFVAGHTYDFWGLVDVTIFGLTAAFLVIRTGGLEAAIAAHVANNLVLFTLESFNAFAVTSQEYGAIDVLPTVLTSVVFVLIVEWMARAQGLERTRPPLPPKPAPQMWAPAWPYPQPYPYGYPPQPYPVYAYPPQPYPAYPAYQPHPPQPDPYAPPPPMNPTPPLPPPPGGTS